VAAEEPRRGELAQLVADSGKTVEVRDQVRSGRFSPVSFIVSIRFMRLASTKGPFFEDLLTRVLSFSTRAERRVKIPSRENAQHFSGH
jgi:hypothetical protein